MFDILTKITKERMKRGWSEYQLAQNSGIAQSTISTWYRKNMQPSVSSLEKICNGLGITLAQFFSDEIPTGLSPEQFEFLNLFQSLNKEERSAILNLMNVMHHSSKSL